MSPIEDEASSSRKKEPGLGSRTIQDEEAKTTSDGDEEAKATSDGLNLAPADPRFDIFIGGHELPRRYVTESDYIPWSSSNNESDYEEPLSDNESEYEEPLSVTTKPPPKHCEMCSLVHSCWDNCHNKVCRCCASISHYSFSCPYKEHFPRGEKYNDKVYNVHCLFDCWFFDTENWVCTSKYCFFTEAKLVPKECMICCSLGKHNTYECHEDPDRASDYYKSIMKDYPRARSIK